MKIAIVNDLPLAVESMRRALALRPEHQVAWIAKTGAEAVEMCRNQTPDLVLMDLLMPGIDGVETTRRIMAHSPCPILIVTVSVGANARRVFEAMGNGALDAVDTPALGFGDPAKSAAPLLRKIDVIKRLVQDGNRQASSTRINTHSLDALRGRLVAIGASAGGPVAVAQVLAGLPAGFQVPIVIVQHVDAQFAEGMAEWLSQQCGRTVRVARVGDKPATGDILLAGTNDHLVFTSPDALGYTPDPEDYPYRPSVDAFFESIAQHYRGQLVAALLTGMGRDGAIGLKALRNIGWHTIAQDQATSAVYGMPKAAAAIGAAVEVLPLDRIAQAISKKFSNPV